MHNKLGHIIYMVKASLQQHSTSTVNLFSFSEIFVCAVLEENLGNWVHFLPLGDMAIQTTL